MPLQRFIFNLIKGVLRCILYFFVIMQTDEYLYHI